MISFQPIIPGSLIPRFSLRDSLGTRLHPRGEQSELASYPFREWAWERGYIPGGNYVPCAGPGNEVTSRGGGGGGGGGGEHGKTSGLQCPTNGLRRNSVMKEATTRVHRCGIISPTVLAPLLNDVRQATHYWTRIIDHMIGGLPAV